MAGQEVINLVNHPVSSHHHGQRVVEELENWKKAEEMRLKDKVAIITGGTAGIGREIARGYIRGGCTVVAVSGSVACVEAMARGLKDMGHKGLSLRVDVTKKAEVDAIVGKVIKEFGKIDILVNNAAIYPATPFLETSEEEWLRVMDVKF